ncbi:BnaAnng17690D [Brassica napus]|uniref:BnaAnng17690D protein n=1 Tax=Brassica napus TaxID=3708 RepID=A0A078JC30_BRANA|nr:BnaAnng17690D [Brassica napus]
MGLGQSSSGTPWICPFPLSLSPDQIYQSIQSALVKMGSSDKITIWAYVNHTKKTSKKTWDSRIYFLPGGDKASRRVRIETCSKKYKGG